MKKFLVLLLGVAIFGCKTTQKPAAKSVVQQPIADALLWKIHGNGLSKPSYLYGTYHIMCKEDVEFTPETKKALADAEQLVLEMDLGDMSNTMALMQLLNMKEGKKLKDFYTDVEYKRLAGFLKDSIGLDLAMFTAIKPFFLEAMMYPKMVDCKTLSGVDQELMALAKDQGKKVRGLETAEMQAAIFDKMPYDVQAKMLYKNVDSFSQKKQEMAVMYNIYRKRELSKLLPMLENDDAGFAGFLPDMLDKRNANWVALLKDWMKDKPLFVAVGAGHLGGKMGVIELLKKEGFVVVPIN